MVAAPYLPLDSHLLERKRDPALSPVLLGTTPLTSTGTPGVHAEPRRGMCFLGSLQLGETLWFKVQMEDPSRVSEGAEDVSEGLRGRLLLPPPGPR